MEELQRSLALFQPEAVLTAGLLLVVVVDSIGAAWRNTAMRLLTLASLALALGLAFNLQGSGAKAAIFSGMLVVDPLGAAFKVVLVAAGLLTVLAFTFRNSRELHGLGQGELMALVLALVLLDLLGASNDLVMLYLALEMVSIVLRDGGLPEGDRMSNEASLRYVLFGAASTGTMLYGCPSTG
jgi:NADH-quinone oxidoreductase subunit N